MTTGLACPYCPAARFPSRTRLNEHSEECRLRFLPPADPLAVLREALVWAEDAGAFDTLASYERQLLDVTKLAPGKPIPGYPVSLFGQHESVSVRVAMASKASGAALIVHLLYRDGTSWKMRRMLPPEFAVRPINTLQKEAA